MNTIREHLLLEHALRELETAERKLGMQNSITEESFQIFRKSVAKGLTKGRSISEILAACTYAAARRFGMPTKLEDIGEAFGVKRKSVARCYRMLISELEIAIPLPTYTPYVDDISNKIGLDSSVRESAEGILENAHKANLTLGKDPGGLAGAALYLACVVAGNGKTQKEIAGAAGVAEVTLRNQCLVLRRALDRTQP